MKRTRSLLTWGALAAEWLEGEGGSVRGMQSLHARGFGSDQDEGVR